MSDPAQGPADSGAESTTAPATPEYVSKDEFRSVMSGMLKSMLPKVVQETLAPSLETKFAELQAKIAAATGSAPSQSQEPDAAPKGDAKAKAKDEPSAELVAMQKRVAELERATKDANEKYARERQRSIETKALSDLKSMLGGKVRPDAVDTVADLIKGRGHITYDDDGNALMRVVVSQKGFEDEEHTLPLAQAIPHFLKSKEASFFTPPPATGAGGAKPKLPNAARLPNGQFANGGAKTTAESFEALGFGSLEDNL